VSEDRVVAIELAKKRGAKVIFLDDGFNRANIKKFEILLFPQKIKNYMPFPAGPFREFIFTKVFADLNLIENRDFKRVVDIANIKDKMLLVTAISNPYRLEPFLPSDNIVEKIYLKDHAYFDEKSLKEKMLLTGANSLLVTQKDEVKMENFKLELSVMRLKLEIKKEVIKRIDEYIDSYKE
jgi:tetraacyldisaccharide 4'-kinase